MRLFYAIVLLFSGLSVVAQNNTTNVLAPIVDFSVENTCFLDTTQFADLSSISAPNQIVNRHWDFGDGTETWSLEMPQHKYSTVGFFTVTLQVIADDYTTGIKTTEIEIFALPDVEFQYSIDTIFEQGNKLSISITEQYESYFWSNGSTSPTIDVNESGIFSLNVTDINGCINNAITSQIVVIEPTDIIEIESNILTPNGDGMNDFLRIFNFYDYQNPISLLIFDAQGRKVYETGNYQNDWDGNSNGKILSAGAYYYIMRSAGKKDENGVINILN